MTQSESKTLALVGLVEKVISINSSVLELQQNTKSNTKSDTKSKTDIAKLNEILAQLMECLSKLKDELATSPDNLPNTDTDADADTDAEPKTDADFVEQIIDAASYELADLIFDKYFNHSVESVGKPPRKIKIKCHT